MPADYDFPEDLLALQREFFTAEAAWTRAARAGDDAATTVAYQRTQDAAVALSRDPWLAAQPNRYEARMALRGAARAVE